jgi:polar amino acid transport system substrate-binding protein
MRRMSVRARVASRSIRWLIAVAALMLAATAATAPAAAQTGSAAPAADDEPAPPTAGAHVLRVYTKPIEPFAFRQDGRAMGFSIDLWERVARQAGLRYEIHWVTSVGELIEALQSGTADVAIAAISITSDREAVVDFSTPYYESGLGILVNAQGQSPVRVILDALLSKSFIGVCLILIAVLLAIAHLIWIFERHQNPSKFPRGYLKGVAESTWWAVSTILSGGCEDKGLLATGGRIIGALWMLICIVAITYFTAAITTIMTVNQLTSDISGAGDLPGQRVATVRGTTAERYLHEHRAKVTAYDSIDKAFDALERHTVKAVVYDEPVLLYHVKIAGGSDQKVVGRLFERQNYGIGLPNRSPYRKTINRALLHLREDGVLDELSAKWFGDRE